MRRIVVVAALVASSGCGSSSETEKWRRSAEDYRTQLEAANTALEQTRKDFKEKSGNWQVQSQKLGAAMLDATMILDPYEIRKIYQDNRDLPTVVEQLQTKIASAAPKEAEPALTDAQLRFDVTGYKGRSVIKAYLDYDSAPFLKSELAATEPVLRLPYNVANQFYDELLKADRAQTSESAGSFFALGDAAKEEMTAKLADTRFAARRAEIDARYKNAVTAEFSAYLERGNSDKPQQVPKPVFVPSQFSTPGRHEIRIELEPKTLDWEVRLTATEVAKEKKDKTIMYWQLNASTTPLTTNIPRLVFWTRSRPADRN
jgi:hypothetical protein